MACTVMALRFFTNKQYQTISLAKDAYEASVYKPEGGHISHMHYREYAEWVTKYGIKATVYSRLHVTGIRFILSQGGLVMVSVNPNIRGYNTANPAKRGGHLILVTGYDNTTQTITFHNPSGFVSNGSHADHTLPLSQFQTFFAGRGIGFINNSKF
jgi:C1A family cysteine protease